MAVDPACLIRPRPATDPSPDPRRLEKAPSRDTLCPRERAVHSLWTPGVEPRIWDMHSPKGEGCSLAPGSGLQIRSKLFPPGVQLALVNRVENLQARHTTPLGGVEDAAADEYGLVKRHAVGFLQDDHG